jgi:FKBP-type peptidyl-prolyl cis-trans isomerase FklB
VQLSAALYLKRNLLRNSTFMKYFVISIATFALAVPAFAQDKPVQLKDQKDKISYSLGLNVGFILMRQNVDLADLNVDTLMAGVKDSLGGKKPALSETEVREVLTAWQNAVLEKQKGMAAKNQADGEKFLAENKKKDGVKTTASGLQYKSLKEGNGPVPTAADTVTVNYRGTLTDGTEFDSSYKRGEPATFPLNGVIKGWTEGLQLMKKGAKYEFVIPAGLAYGERSPMSKIPPNSTLKFEVELVDVKAAPPEPSPAASAPPAAK